MVSLWFPYAIFKLKPHEHQNPSLLIIEHLKNYYSPNDRFLIKFFIKIISLDSSQRVPPMSPCPPLIIIRGAVYLGRIQGPCGGEGGG